MKASCCPPAAQRQRFALLRCSCKDTFAAWGARGRRAAPLRLWGCSSGLGGCSQQVQQGQAGASGGSQLASPCGEAPVLGKLEAPFLRVTPVPDSQGT